MGVLLEKATPAQYKDLVGIYPRVISVRNRVKVKVDKLRADECHLVVRVREDGGEVTLEKDVDDVDHAVGSME